MKKDLIALAGLLAVVTLLTGCEGQTDYTKFVRNYSSDTLFISVFSDHGRTFYMADSLVIPPGNEETVLYYDQLGGNSRRRPCLEYIDSIKTWLSHDKKLVKDIMDNDNWTLYISKRGLGGSLVDQDCYFEFSDDDLQ